LLFQRRGNILAEKEKRPIDFISAKLFSMASKNIQESQQQGQGITIGTQGNEDQPTPMGDDLSYQRSGGKDDRSIPNQDKSSATNQRRAESGNDDNP
jgi:hypothetical protein